MDNTPCLFNRPSDDLGDNDERPFVFRRHLVKLHLDEANRKRQTGSALDCLGQKRHVWGHSITDYQ